MGIHGQYVIEIISQTFANNFPDGLTFNSTATLTEAPGNGAPIGGLKVQTENAWFAARPSGTEDVYKIYAESFKGSGHLKQIQAEAQAIVSKALRGAGAAT